MSNWFPSEIKLLEKLSDEITYAVNVSPRQVLFVLEHLVEEQRRKVKDWES